jgi:hypothetical protein
MQPAVEWLASSTFGECTKTAPSKSESLAPLAREKSPVISGRPARVTAIHRNTRAALNDRSSSDLGDVNDA